MDDESAALHATADDYNFQKQSDYQESVGRWLSQNQCSKQERSDCSICLNVNDDDEDHVKLACEHTFCITCMWTWIVKYHFGKPEYHCPNCRKKNSLEQFG